MNWMRYLKAVTTLAAALVASMMASPVMAQNCQTYYRPWEPMTGPGGHYGCYQRFVWYNQGKGSWCARDWYRSCMHSGLHNETGGNNSPHAWTDEAGNPITESEGWVTGYSAHDDGRVAPRNIYVSGGQIIVHPYVCRGSLKTSPEDPGQRIESNDSRAMELFPNPTLAEIQQYKTSGACSACPAAGNDTGTGCN